MLIVFILFASIKCHAIHLPTVFNPYVGLGYRHTHWPLSTDYSTIFANNFNLSTAFVGNRYSNNFGVELGYYHAVNSTQKSGEISSFFGTTASGTTSFNSKLRFDGFSLDVLGYQDLSSQFHLLGSIGIQTIHTEMEIVSPSSTDLASSLGLITAHNNLIARVGFGIEYSNFHFGIRTKASFDTARNYELNLREVSSPFNDIPKRLFKNGYSIDVGLFFRL